jgi:PAS domain S-box-containing protein
MTLRKKTLTIIGITLIALISILYGTSRIILLRGFAELEKQSLGQNVERAKSMLFENLAALSSSTADWAAWDDTYEFIEDTNEDYIKTNLVDGTFRELRLNFMLFVNSSGHIVFGKGFDLNDKKEIPIPKSFLKHLSANQKTILQYSDIKSTKGIVLLPDGPVLISSYPIVTSEEKGPIRGTLIMGRYLDSKEIKHLAETTHLSLTINQIKDSQTPSDLQIAGLSSRNGSPILVKPLNEHSIVGYALINDIYEKPALVLKVDMPRQIYKQGKSTLFYYLLSLLVFGLVFIGITLLLLESVILSRLAHLHRDVSSIDKSRDLSKRISVAGKDELSSLAGVINKMLESLQNSQDSLQKSEERYRSLVETAPDVIFSLSIVDGTITSLNPIFEKITGWSRAEWLGKSFMDIIHPDDISIPKEIFQQVSSGKITPPFELRILTKSGEYRVVEFIIEPEIKNGKVFGIFGFARDISERKRMEESLRESEGKLSAMLESIGDHMSMMDKDLDIIWANETAKKAFGNDIIGKKCYEVYHRRREPCEPYPCLTLKAFQDGKVHEHDTQVIDKDGKIIYFHCIANVSLRDKEGKPTGVIEISRDITKQVQARKALLESEKKLRSLSSQLLSAQERERQRISKELHDELGQALTVLKLQLRSIEKKLRKDQIALRGDFEETLHFIDGVIENVRRLSRDLSPSILEDLGLRAALQWMIDNFTKHYNIKSSVDMAKIDSFFSQEEQILIFRIFQESLTNIVKHAQANHLSIIIRQQEGKVSFVVEDDGNGFDVNLIRASDVTEKGLGLAAMEERTHMLGGSLNIWSQEKEGTRITITIPVEEEKNR